MLLKTIVTNASRISWLAVVLMTGFLTAGARERVFVLTDISNEPDDEESLVRFLVYSNEYDVEGIVATTSTHLKQGTREDLIRRQLTAYGKVRSSLALHATGFPAQEELEAVVATGQPSYGMAAVGEGMDTAGSRLLLAAADRDERPIWVCVWGGANTLAQALYDARNERSPEELDKLVDKLRVYTISDQDDAGRWLRLEFPGLFYIVSPSTAESWMEYHQATWTGISGDRNYRNGPFLDFDMVDNPWLEENVIRGHGPLGELYPRVAYIMEGDTPSFLGLINNGLGWAGSPAYGGWGGRYVLFRSYAESRPIWTNNIRSRDTVEVDGVAHVSDQATIYRWRRHFQNDFAARMDWCVADEYRGANHNPVAVLNGDRTRDVIRINADAGDKIELSAAGSSDPDGDAVACSWMIYREAGTLKGDFELTDNTGEKTFLKVPEPGSGKSSHGTIHVILTVEDNGSPNLVSYRRAIITVE